MYKWTEINKRWLNRNKHLIYEYYIIKVNPNKHHSPVITDYTFELRTFIENKIKQKTVCIRWNNGTHKTEDIVITTTAEKYAIYKHKTLGEFNRYFLRKNNLNILLNT